MVVNCTSPQSASYGPTGHSLCTSLNLFESANPALGSGLPPWPFEVLNKLALPSLEKQDHKVVAILECD